MESETDTFELTRREFLWRFAKHELEADDFDWARSHLDELTNLSIDPATPVLRHVWSELRDNVDRLASEIGVLRPLSEAVDDRTRLHAETNAKTIEAQDELFAAFAEEGLRPLALKGAAARGLLGGLQAMNDLDILTRDLDETWKVAGLAERLGYSLNKIKVRHADPSVPGPVRHHGYANLYRLEGGGAYVQGDWDLGRVRTLDLHVARFYGPGESVLRTDVFSRAWELEIEGTPVSVTSPEDSLLVEFMHLIRHGTLALRGVNRICQIFDRHMVDIDYVASEVAANDLAPVARATLLAVASTFSHSSPQVYRLLAALPPASPLLRPAIHRVAAMRRVERYGAGNAASVMLQAAHVYDVARRTNGIPRAARTAAVAASRMYRARHVYPRAHDRWATRRQGWVSEQSPAIVLGRIDDVPVATQDAEPWLHAELRDCELVTKTTLLADAHGPSEVVLTPIGAFATTRYDGSIDPNERRRSLERAAQVRTVLAVAPKANGRLLASGDGSCTGVADRREGDRHGG